jgi:hypothetical protein
MMMIVIFCFFSSILIIYSIAFSFIIDDDSGVKETIFDIFQFEESKDELNPTYYNPEKPDEIINFDSDFYQNLAIFPNQGGITSPYDKLLIEIQFLSGIDKYKIETIEINNPEVCNLNSFNVRQSNDQNYSDKKEWTSILLDNGEPLVDVNYLKEFHGFNEDLQDFYYLYILFNSTNNGQNPGPCELRAFARYI